MITINLFLINTKAYEDIIRHRADAEFNSKEVRVIRDGTFVTIKSKDIRVIIDFCFHYII